MAYGTTPTSTTSLGANQFPASAVYTPNTAGGNFTALQGGPVSSADGNGNVSAPVATYVPDGNDVALGTSTDAANANSVVGQLKQIKTNTASVTVGALPALPAGGNTIGGVELVDSGGTNKAAISAAGAVKVDNSAVTQPVSGTVTANQGGTWTVQPGNTANTTPWLTQPVAGASGGSTPSHAISAATTNATNVKASAGLLYGLSISNTNAAARYFKLYDKATAPIVGTDTPKMTIQVPGNGTVIRAFPVGLAFAAGIGYAATGAITDGDTTAIGLNDLSMDLDYK